MSRGSCLFVVLAAGEGTRMRSSLPKVMHALANEPLLGHVLGAAGDAEPDARIAIVVGPGHEKVSEFAKKRAPNAAVFVQQERQGTAHAVLAARAAIDTHEGDVVVLYGDTPLLTPETISRLRSAVQDGADLAVLGFMASDPSGYGRLILEEDRLVAIREERDADEADRALGFCNSGVMAFRSGLLPDLVQAIGNTNAKGEYYLTDAVEIAVGRGLKAVAIEGNEAEMLGVNSRTQLAEAEAGLQDRLRLAALANGATLVAPETVFFSMDTKLGEDVVIEPNVFFGPDVSIGDHVTIHAFCHITGATIASGAIIGPFARLRPGTALGEGTRIGNFVEVKAAEIGRGAKINHLSYVGDTRVGERANIGAGTITCNYDGSAKHRTEIGAGAFIGSNSALVAPVAIGDGAYVGSGSVITKDVKAGSLAIARGRQVEKPGWVVNIKSGGEAKADADESEG